MKGCAEMKKNIGFITICIVVSVAALLVGYSSVSKMLNEEYVTLFNDDTWVKEENKWEEDYKGLKFSSRWIALNEEYEYESDPGDKHSSQAIALDLTVENKSDEEFTTIPSYGSITTSTGEKTGFSVNGTYIGGKFSEGEKNNAVLLIQLKKSKLEEVDWIDLEWEVKYKNKTEKMHKKIKL